MVEKYEMYIGGEWVPARSGKMLDSVDPWRQEVWARVPEGDETDVDRAVAAARSAFENSWWARDAHRRGTVLRRLADLVDQNVDRFAAIEGRDNGKIIRDELALSRNIAGYYRYAPSLVESFADSAPVGANPDVFALTRRIPYGVIGIQTPWNTPGILLAQSASSALAAGNTIVVKPSEVASCSTLEFARLAHEAGFPPGVINVVTGYGPVVGARLCSHPDVDRLVFTGSPEAGVLVAEQAARQLTPVVMELGGKSANVVFADYDVEKAAQAIVFGFTNANGQSCMCGSRALVERSIYDAVLARVLELVREIRFGDPADPATDMGPVCSAAQLDRIRRFVEVGIAEGAKLLTGGGAPEGIDHPLFYEPTVFANVTADMTIFKEEIFGPVLVIMPFDTEDEAIKLTNATDFGLCAAIWTRDLRLAHRVSERIRAGTVWVNAQRRGDPAFGGGGIGRSGYGRLSGVEGHWEMTLSRTVQMYVD